MSINNPKRKGEDLRRKKAKNLGQRKKTIFKKVHELGKYDGIDSNLAYQHLQDAFGFMRREATLHARRLKCEAILNARLHEGLSLICAAHGLIQADINSPGQHLNS